LRVLKPNIANVDPNLVEVEDWSGGLDLRSRCEDRTRRERCP